MLLRMRGFNNTCVWSPFTKTATVNQQKNTSTQHRSLIWLQRITRGLFYATLSFWVNIASAFPPSTECPTPHALSVASHGSVAVDLSSCSIFGLDSVPVLPSHGSLTGINPITGNGTSQFTYVNNGDGATSDTFTVLDDSNGAIIFNVTISAATSITLTPSTLSAATVALAYSQSVTATGGIAPYTYAITAGALPAGLTLSSGGVLSGTPTAGGTFNFTITATDSATGTGPFSGNRIYSLTVGAPTITLTPSSLPAATANSLYSQSVTATGGIAPYTYAITAGALPAGLTLSSGGVLSGTPTAGGTFNFTITATDSATGTGPFSGNRIYSLTVGAPTITLTPSSLPAATANSLYSQSVTATGGIAPYTYAITADALPAGLTLSSGGVLSGTPTAGGTFNFTITATDSATGTGPFSGNRIYSLTVGAPTITLTPNSVPNGTIATSYSTTMSANGGTAPYTYSLTSGALPTGVTLDTLSGTLNGTPTMAGNFSFTVQALDANHFSGTQVYCMTIATTTLTLTPTTLSVPVVGTLYSATFIAGGGTAPYQFTIASGALPSGLTLNSTTGVLSGTANQSGNFSFSVQVTDSSTGTGTPLSTSLSYTFNISSPTITVTPSTIPAATINAPYNQPFTASGGQAPYIYSIVAGHLPAGLTLDSATGVLNGTPTVSDHFTFTVRATDAQNFTGEQAVTLNVEAISPIAATYNATANAGTSVDIDLMANASGGPFTAATIVAITPPTAGTAIIRDIGTNGQTAYQMTFTPTQAFTGAVAISYTLSNVYATSVPGHVNVTVTSRPDMSTNTSVTGLLAGHIDNAQRSATTQIWNFTRRLESLRGDGWARSGIGLNIASPFISNQGLVTHAAQWHSRDIDRIVDAPLQANLHKVSWPSRRNTKISANGNNAALASNEIAHPTFHELADLPIAQEDQRKQRLSLWMLGSIDFGRQYAHGTQAGFKFTTNGVSFGGDYRLNDFASAGLGIGFSRHSNDIQDGNGSKNTAHSVAAAMYGTLRPTKEVFVDGILGYGTLRFDTSRYINNSAGFANGSRDGGQLFGALISGVEFRHSAWMWSPYGGLEMTATTLDQYTEAASDVHALTYFKQTLRTTNSVLGLRTESAYTTRIGTWVPRAKFEFRHQFHAIDDGAVAYADLAATGPAYIVQMIDQGRNTWSAGLGTKLLMRNHLRFMADYTYNFNVGHGHHQSIIFKVELPFF